ncbi:hypothetical protein [Sulfitobacter sp.]|uniref:hypothetical protein n=1 Tax=Sulfitobacter sp. TaxID=1903071 RepID=UPI003002922D
MASKSAQIPTLVLRAASGTVANVQTFQFPLINIRERMPSQEHLLAVPCPNALT